jgi:type II secretory pathway component GspD/PulD (secretin)
MITDANTQQMLPAGNTNSLVLTGFGAQIGALAEMLGRVDLASRVESVELEMISLEHADANKVLGTLLSIVHPPKSGEGDSPSLPASAARIVSDSRTNSLLVSARPKDMAKIKELIAQLDRGE